MPEILKEILTTYWSQTVLIIAAIGYLIKLVFDLRSKKVEQKHSLFQQNRVNQIMKFINCYLELKQAYEMIFVKRISINKISLSEVDKLFSNRFSDLYSAYFFLKLYLEPIELSRYSDLVIEMKKVVFKINSVHNEINASNEKELQEELNTIIETTIKNNNDNFKVIGELFRKYSDKPYSLR